jgi:hypothetical protein
VKDLEINGSCIFSLKTVGLAVVLFKHYTTEKYEAVEV